MDYLTYIKNVYLITPMQKKMNFIDGLYLALLTSLFVNDFTTWIISLLGCGVLAYTDDLYRGWKHNLDNAVYSIVGIICGLLAKESILLLLLIL